MRSRRLFLLAAASIGVVAGLLAAAAKSHADEHRRLVVIGGDLTEIVFAIGAGERVIGADSTSTYPAETETLEKVGYMRRLSPEGVLALAPDLVIASADAGPDTALDQLRSAGVAVVVAPDDPSLEGVYEKIAFIGKALEEEEAAKALIASIQGEMSEVANAIASVKDVQSVMFILSVRGGSLLAAGEDTSAHAMIELAGGRNAVSGFEGYKPLSAEIALAAAPEVIIAPAHSSEALGGLEAIKARTELATTPAVIEDRVAIMDGLLLLGFGPRTPQAIAELAGHLHSDFEAPQLGWN